MCLGSFENVINKMRLQIIYIKYKCTEELALNNRQSLICHKNPTKPTSQKTTIQNPPLNYIKIIKRGTNFRNYNLTSFLISVQSN